MNTPMNTHTRTNTRLRDSEFTFMFQLISYSFIIILSIMCLLPFLLILSGSFSSNESIVRDGYHLFPTDFSLEGYKMVFKFPTQVLKAYGVTVFTTVVGTTLGLFLITMAGFVLQRKDFKYRNTFSFLSTSQPCLVGDLCLGTLCWRTTSISQIRTPYLFSRG